MTILSRCYINDIFIALGVALQSIVGLANMIVNGLFTSGNELTALSDALNGTDVLVSGEKFGLFLKAITKAQIPSASLDYTVI